MVRAVATRTAAGDWKAVRVSAELAEVEGAAEVQAARALEATRAPETATYSTRAEQMVPLRVAGSVPSSTAGSGSAVRARAA